MFNLILAVLAVGASPLPVVEVRVAFRSFAGKTEHGLIEVHERVAEEVAAIFAEIHRAGFPIRSIRPIREFGSSDEASMKANNTSGYCYRNIAGTKKLSDHAYGLAIDINPLQNPHLNRRGRPKTPGRYRPGAPGTIEASGPVVRAFERRGWKWGGRWKTSKDMMHFSRRIY